MMSCINTSSSDAGNGINVGNTAGTVPSVMTNSIKNVDLIIKTLIKLVTETEYITGGGYVIAVALHQQGITTFEHLCEFPFGAEFERKQSMRLNFISKSISKCLDFILSVKPKTANIYKCRCYQLLNIKKGRAWQDRTSLTTLLFKIKRSFIQKNSLPFLC